MNKEGNLLSPRITCLKDLLKVINNICTVRDYTSFSDDLLFLKENFLMCCPLFKHLIPFEILEEFMKINGDIIDEPKERKNKKAVDEPETSKELEEEENSELDDKNKKEYFLESLRNDLIRLLLLFSSQPPFNPPLAQIRPSMYPVCYNIIFFFFCFGIFFFF
jgi:hypothetical protein